MERLMIRETTRPTPMRAIRERLDAGTMRCRVRWRSLRARSSCHKSVCEAPRPTGRKPIWQEPG
jgi:hypothetical protein